MHEAKEPAHEAEKPAAPQGRSARKRREILAAAAELFLREGYQGASMDQVAALASVSKQTVYKQFSSKEGLFATILDRIAAHAGEFIDRETLALRDTDDVERDLRGFAHGYLATVMQPRVLRLRRLLIGEAGRLPELARSYYERVPERTLDVLAGCFAHLVGRGLLRADDPRLAASHFAFLILGAPLDRALFRGDDAAPDAAEHDRLCDEGVRAFLAAYGVG